MCNGIVCGTVFKCIKYAVVVILLQPIILIFFQRIHVAVFIGCLVAHITASSLFNRTAPQIRVV